MENENVNGTLVQNTLHSGKGGELKDITPTEGRLCPSAKTSSKGSIIHP